MPIPTEAPPVLGKRRSCWRPAPFEIRRQHLRGLCVALIVLAACSKSAAPKGEASAEAAHREPAGRLVYLVPDQLPDGMELNKLEDYNLPHERQEPGGYGAVVGTGQGDTEFTDIVHVVVHEAKEDREIGADERKQYEIVNINGAPARFLDDEITGASVDWYQDGLAVAVAGPPDARKLVTAIARALRLPASGDPTDVKLRRLPGGQKLVAEESFRSYRGESYSFSALSTKGGRPRSLIVGVDRVPEGSISPAIVAVGTERLRYLKLRGTSAAFGSQSTELQSPDGRTTTIDSTSVAWFEYPDILAVIIGTEIDEEAIVTFAEGFEEASEQEWRSRFES